MSVDVPPVAAQDGAAPPPAASEPVAPRSRWLQARALVLRIGDWLRSRVGRKVAVAAVAVSAFAAMGHFVGGMIGWWHAYEVAFGHPKSSSPAEKSGAAIKAPPLSLAVLPFANDGHPDDAWLTENLTSDVATELSRIPGSSVIGRESAAAYRGRDIDPRQVAAELKVRYLLLGQAQRNGESVRVRVRLIDGQTGSQRWAEKFDVDRASLRQLTDELSLRLARAVDLQLHRSEGHRAARLPPDEALADDLAMQGFGLLYGGIHPGTASKALALFEQAIAKDPNSVRGWGGVAMSSMYLQRWGADPGSRQRLEQAVARLQVLDPTGLATLYSAAFLPLARADLNATLAGADRMVSYYPGHHTGYAMRATALVRMGRFEEALDATDRALALLPNDPDPANKWRRSYIMYALGRYPEAISLGREVMAASPNSGIGAATLLAALVRNGMPDEARQLLASIRTQQPDYTLARVRPILSGTGERYLATREDFLAALREIGLE